MASRQSVSTCCKARRRSSRAAPLRTSWAIEGSSRRRRLAGRRAPQDGPGGADVREQHRRPLRQEGLQAAQPELDLRGGKGTVVAVAEQRAAAQAAVEGGDGGAGEPGQAGGGLHQGPVDLAVRLQALVEGPRQARRLLDRHGIGHRQHGRHAQVAHQALSQAAEGALGLRRGGSAIAGGEEGEAGQGGASAEVVQAVEEAGSGDGVDVPGGRGEVDHGLPAGAEEAPVADGVQEGVRLLRELRDEGIQGGWPDGARHFGRAQDVAADAPEGLPHTCAAAGGVEGGEAVSGPRRRAGLPPRSGPADRAARWGGSGAPSGWGGRGRGGPLVQGQETPAVATGGAEALPAQGAQVRGLNGEEDAEARLAARGGAGEGVAHGVHEEGLAEDGAVALGIEGEGEEGGDVQAEGAFDAHRQPATRRDVLHHHRPASLKPPRPARWLFSPPPAPRPGPPLPASRRSGPPRWTVISNVWKGSRAGASAVPPVACAADASVPATPFRPARRGNGVPVQPGAPAAGRVAGVPA